MNDLEAPATPCGLHAKSFFNDEFTLSTDNRSLNLNVDQIVWPNDLKYRFKNVENWQEKQWISMEDGKST